MAEIQLTIRNTEATGAHHQAKQISEGAALRYNDQISMSAFTQPSLLGFSFRIEDDLSAMVTDERDDELFIESKPFTGWVYRAEFYERIGKDALGWYLDDH